MTDTAAWDRYIGYFDQQVLASYLNESHKWTVENDCFEGHVQIADEYYETAIEVDAERAARRWHVLQHVPKIARPAVPGSSIHEAAQMDGKTIASVECGFRHDIPGVHQSELLMIHFTDASIVSIDTGSNAHSLVNRQVDFKEEDLHVDLQVQLVPALQPSSKAGVSE